MNDEDFRIELGVRFLWSDKFSGMTCGEISDRVKQLLALVQPEERVFFVSMFDAQLKEHSDKS